MFGGFKGGFLNKNKKKKKSSHSGKSQPEAAKKGAPKAKNAPSTHHDKTKNSKDSTDRKKINAHSPEDVDTLSWILQLIRKRQVELQGGFLKELLQPRAFRRHMYPMDSEDSVVEKGLPKNIDEFLAECDAVCDTPSKKGRGRARFLPEVLAAMPAVRAKTESILAGVSKRARAAGEDFDSETSNILRPQVALEAFARRLPGIVQATAARLQRERTVGTTAFEETLSQNDEEDKTHKIPPERLALNSQLGAQHQLPSHAIVSLLGAAGASAEKRRRRNRWAVVESFLGKEWVRCVAADCARYLQFEGADNLHRLPSSSSQTDKPSDVCGGGGGSSSRRRRRASSLPEGCDSPLVGELPLPSVLSKEYPALAEVLNSLRLLPFELNCRGGGGGGGGGQGDRKDPVQLCLPASQGAMTLQVFDHSTCQYSRRINNPGGVKHRHQPHSPNATDNGVAVTALYHVFAEPDGRIQRTPPHILRLQSTDNDEQVIQMHGWLPESDVE